MLGLIKNWFVALSTVAKVGVVTAAVVTGGVVSSSVQPQTTTQPTKPISTQKAVIVCNEADTVTTETQPLPFDKTTVSDSNTASGQSYVKTAGVNGVKTLTYNVVTYSPAGCKQGTKTLVKEETTTQPITEVTAIGTYVAPVVQSCPNGTYVNTAGNTVCSPYSSNTVPSGATAKCGDGTYSFSQSRSGTCSHHGGVAAWL